MSHPGWISGHDNFGVPIPFALPVSQERTMPTTAEAPIYVSLRAADFTLGLGFWPQLKLMLDHTRQTIKGLRSIAVSLDEEGREDDPRVLILAESDDTESVASDRADESAEWRWDRWAAETFPPDVLRHFCMMTLPVGGESTDGR